MLFNMAEGNISLYNEYKRMDVVEFLRVQKNHMKMVKQKAKAQHGH